ncbi:hypothetical protein AVEN_120687-1 [Araneus ventricosus]|uniref:Uncharacterized protein n=1 Tax=Araneus ventricosus TaxID=182803 RepID=A0A4Y2WAV5_ARAVE|nr:hypothetical protein AVEN_120687-1 [Araneus ventricosus]
MTQSNSTTIKEGDLFGCITPATERPESCYNRTGKDLYSCQANWNDVVHRAQRMPNAKPKVIHINRLVPYRATGSYSCNKTAGRSVFGREQQA